VIGDLAIVYVDGSQERLADVRLDIEGEWLRVAGRRDPEGQWHEERWIPAARLKEVRRWDRFNWHASYEAVMQMTPEGLKALMEAPIQVAKGEPE
jgi:hypothetical protein